MSADQIPNLDLKQMSKQSQTDVLGFLVPWSSLKQGERILPKKNLKIVAYAVAWKSDENINAVHDEAQTRTHAYYKPIETTVMLSSDILH